MAAPEHLTYLGHSTVLLEVQGVRLMTDPVLRRGATFLRRMPQATDVTSYTDVDIALLSHLHHDHLDLPSLRRLGERCCIVAPAGAGSWLRRKGLTDVVELSPGESMTHGSMTITATPAEHSGKREPFGPEAMAVGYIINSGPACLYFAGDTDLFDGMADLIEPGMLDVALLPVWGWGPNLGEGHLDPGRAAQAAAMLQPRFAVPIHWGTFAPVGMHRMKLATHREPPVEFAEAVRRLGLDVQVLITQPGERVAFDA